jgi:hypothetical protein
VEAGAIPIGTPRVLRASVESVALGKAAGGYAAELMLLTVRVEILVGERHLIPFVAVRRTSPEPAPPLAVSSINPDVSTSDPKPSAILAVVPSEGLVYVKFVVFPNDRKLEILPVVFSILNGEAVFPTPSSPDVPSSAGKDKVDTVRFAGTTAAP